MSYENFWNTFIPLGYGLLMLLAIVTLFMIIIALYKYIKNS